MEHRRLLGAADRPRSLWRRPDGVWLNRVHTFEVGEGASGRTVHFPRSCLHCEEPACVTVCPTGASYKRAEDGIVLVDEDNCIGCKLCSWACPYGAREFDDDDGVMKKCTLCVDRIYNENLRRGGPRAGLRARLPDRRAPFRRPRRSRLAVSQLVAERGGFDLMPELGYQPVNKYLPPRARRDAKRAAAPCAPTRDAGASRAVTATEQLSRAGSTACCRADRIAMHPAYSVILFTTASGAGYGLLALLGAVGAASALLPAGAAGFGLRRLRPRARR